MTNNSTYINRFLFYGFIVTQIEPQYFLNFSKFPDVLWLPAGIFQVLESPLHLSNTAIQGVSWIWYVSAIFSGLGVRFKESSVVFAAINFLIFTLSQSYGYQTHSFMALTLGAFLMALGSDQTPQLMRIMYCMIFFSAGVSKIRHGGLEWVVSDSLQNILIRSQIYYSDAHAWANSLNLNLVIAQSKTLCSFIAGVVVILELLAPWALFSRKAAKIIVPSLLIMQIGIYFTVLVNFKFYFLMYIFWIDWDWLLKRTARLTIIQKAIALVRLYGGKRKI